MEWGKLREVFIAGGTVGDPADPIRRYGIKRVSILFRHPLEGIFDILYISCIRCTHCTVLMLL